MLGGRGESASCDGSRAITFANNEGWHDDVSDGPVTATVTLGGLPLEVIPSWVVVAPPNYAPQRKSVRTMWDLMRDVAIQAGTLARPVRPSFRDDILPLFERLAGLQWVNAGFAAGFGVDGAVDLTSATALARLASPLPAHREVRRTVARSFRDFDVDGMSPKPWPWLYGDAMNIPPVPSPRQNAALTATQLWMLEQWAEGCFDADLDTDADLGAERRAPSCPGAAPGHRRAAGAGAGRHAHPGRSGVLSGRRLPPRMRDDVAGARRDDVPRTVPVRATRTPTGSRRRSGPCSPPTR